MQQHQPNVTPIMHPSAHQEPYVIQQQKPKARVEVNITVGLSIAHLLLGFLSGVLGLALVCYNGPGKFSHYEFYDDNYNLSGSCGIVCGVFIFITGILGIISYRDPTNHCKNGVYMGFCIFSCICGLLMGTVFGVGVGIFSQCGWYNNVYGCMNHTKKVLSAILLTLGVIEFFIALVSAIFTCAFGCCGPDGCCAKKKTGAVYQQLPHHQQYTMNSSSGPTIVQQGYPATSVPQQPYSTTNMAQQPYSTANAQQQPYTTANIPQQPYTQTNVPQQGYMQGAANLPPIQTTAPYHHNHPPIPQASASAQEASNMAYTSENEAPPAYEAKSSGNNV